MSINRLTSPTIKTFALSPRTVLLLFAVKSIAVRLNQFFGVFQGVRVLFENPIIRRCNKNMEMVNKIHSKYPPAKGLLNMKAEIVTQEVIETKIISVRGRKVLLDKDLAVLYGVKTGNLNKAVKRNIKRFPEDFMFKLTKEEHDSLRFQLGILKRGRHSKYLPYAFTENGVAMLSSVLNSEMAVQVNIQIMRTFTRLREILLARKDLRQKIEEMEKKYDYQFKIVFEAIKELLGPPAKPKKPIGF
jgi:phage regulator Rha-like protein